VVLVAVMRKEVMVRGGVAANRDTKRKRLLFFFSSLFFFCSLLSLVFCASFSFLSYSPRFFCSFFFLFCSLSPLSFFFFPIHSTLFSLFFLVFYFISFLCLSAPLSPLGEGVFIKARERGSYHTSIQSW